MPWSSSSIWSNLRNKLTIVLNKAIEDASLLVQCSVFASPLFDYLMGQARHVKFVQKWCTINGQHTLFIKCLLPVSVNSGSTDAKLCSINISIIYKFFCSILALFGSIILLVLCRQSQLFIYWTLFLAIHRLVFIKQNCTSSVDSTSVVFQYSPLLFNRSAHNLQGNMCLWLQHPDNLAGQVQ